MNHIAAILVFTCFSMFSMPCIASHEKKALDHSVYADWKFLSRQQFSNDGNWISYEVHPQKGDGCLYFVDLRNNITDSIARGSRAVFSHSSDFVAYFIEPTTAEVRQAKVEGKSREDMPKNDLGITLLANGETIFTDNVKSFVVPEKQSSWVFYHLEKQPGDTLNGTTLTALNPLTGDEFVFEHVTDYTVSANGRLLSFIKASSDDDGVTGVYVFDTERLSKLEVFYDYGAVTHLTADDAGEQLAFINLPAENVHNKNDIGEGQNGNTGDVRFTDEPVDDPDVTQHRRNRLYFWQLPQEQAIEIVGADTQGMQKNWHVSENAAPYFCHEGKHLFFGTAPLPPPKPVDTLLPEEKHSVDVWHYRDPLIQPMQLVQLERERKRSYVAAYHIEDGTMVQLADENMPDITINRKNITKTVMGESKLPYLIQNSFESGDYRDVYLVDMETGGREMVLQKHRGSVHLSRRGDARLSPGGNYLVYYNQEDRSWHALSVEERTLVNLTESIPQPLFDELHDAPGEPDPYGIAGWIENDGYVLIYDRFDIWKVDPTGQKSAVSLTNNYGRNNNMRFRYVALNDEDGFVGRRERIMLSAFHIYNKQSGFYSIRVNRPGNPEQIIMDDAHFFNPIKAVDADILAWRRSTFEDYPDLWVSNLDFGNPRKISDANPQQAEYLWGSVRLVEWVSFANDSLQGLLYVPENFDPGQKYPMIVYFYERLSDRLHRHYIPTPSRSTINISYSVSNGYVVFVPDIRYRVGYPGRSAYNAIVSGTKAMINQFDFIDRQNIGIQGQSWAGYQIAWLITQTDIFKAAMAGAPVSNMISAYGGIRWVTGMSRIYQYEETQSRIGGTIWDQTLRYIENSPVFFANKVNTPLLMMHNDADGAVPWYQGIEYFMALRRLGKPVWMLNYNDEAHNLTRWPNRMDLSHRMYEFFDHYLKDSPAPTWMTEGVPAVKKNM